MDELKLNELVSTVLQDLGGAFSVPLVQIGEKLGLYKALNESGPVTSAQLAKITSLNPRYVQEWLAAQAGEKKLREFVVDGAGFSVLKRVAETPFNMILEAKP